MVTDLVGRPGALAHDRLYLALCRAIARWPNPAHALRRCCSGWTSAMPGLSLDQRRLDVRRLTVVAPAQPAAGRGRPPRRGDRGRGRASTGDGGAHRADHVGHAGADGRAGVVIGSHTRTHAWLTLERSRARARRGSAARACEIERGWASPSSTSPTRTDVRRGDGRRWRSAGYRFGYTTCTHRDPRQPLLTHSPPDALAERRVVDARGRFSPAILSCQVHGVSAWCADANGQDHGAAHDVSRRRQSRRALARRRVDVRARRSLLISGRTVGFIVAFLIPLVLVRILDQAEFGTYKQLFLIAATLYGVGQLGMAESLYYFLPLAPRPAARYVANSLVALAVGGLGVPRVPRARRRAACPAGSAIGALARYTPALGSTCVSWSRRPCSRSSWSRGSATAGVGAYAVLDLAARRASSWRPCSVPRALDGCSRAPWPSPRSGARSASGTGGSSRGGLHPDAASSRPARLRHAVRSSPASWRSSRPAFTSISSRTDFDPATFAIYSVGCLQIPLVDFVTARCQRDDGADDRADARGPRRGGGGVWHDTTRRLALVFAPVVGAAGGDGASVHRAPVHGAVRGKCARVRRVVAGLLLAARGGRGAARARRDAAARRPQCVATRARARFDQLAAHGVASRGAIAVTVFATAVMKALGVLRIRSLMGVRLGEVLPWRSLGAILAVAAAAAWAAIGVASLLEAPPLVELVVVGALYAAVYVALLHGLGVLTEEERLAVRGLLARWGVARRDVRAGDLGGR